MRLQYLWLITAFVTTVIPASAQEGKFNSVEVVGHIYEPAKLAPTEEQLQKMVRLPEGFHLQRFAEGLDNPRMIAVADDGTVYITQQKPGSLVMLKDVDKDGIADAQKAVAHIANLPAGFNRQALLKAMEGHVLAKGNLVGTFEKKG